MDLQTFLKNIGGFLHDTLMPALIAFAFLFFLWNVVRYFIIGGSNSESQEKARTLALWGILAFVVIFSLWGIIELLVDSLDFGPNRVIKPDYMEGR
jgi:predicted PurR-regulated permease PerM